MYDMYVCIRMYILVLHTYVQYMYLLCIYPYVTTYDYMYTVCDQPSLPSF